MVAQDSLNEYAAKKMDQRSSADIERDIERTREALSVKISRLEEEVEDKVRTTVDQVSGQILDTVDQITGKVKHSVERVQNKLDLRVHMERDPYRTMGGALAAGFAFGVMLAFRGRSQQHQLQRPAKQPAPSFGIYPILKSIATTVAMSAAQRVVQSKVDSYLDSSRKNAAH